MQHMYIKCCILFYIIYIGLCWIYFSEKYEKIIRKLDSRTGLAEHVKNFKLLPDEFSYSEGEVTPVMKIKRKNIMNRYIKDIDSLFAE